MGYLSRRAWRRAAIAFYDEYLSTVTDNALQRHQQNVTLQQQSQQRQKQQQQQQQQEQSSSSSSRRQSSERGKVNNQLWAPTGDNDASRYSSYLAQFSG